MRVLLVGPDLEENLSLRYLAASLRAAGHVPQIAPFETYGDSETVLRAFEKADLVGLSMCYQVRATEFLALARTMKARRPDVPIVAGGHYASCAAHDVLEHHAEIDLIALHEAEQTLCELASLPEFSAATLSRVPGIVCRHGAEIVATAGRDMVLDLDTLPWPDRSGPARLMAGVPTAYMMGSRGCLSRCDYCAITTLHKLVQHGRPLRQRTPENVVREMAYLYHQRGVRQFVFHDDNFLVPDMRKNLERIESFEQAMRREGVDQVGIVLKCRPADVDREVFRRLQRIGLLRVFLGIESGTAGGLSALGRKQSVEDEHRALGICEELGLSTQYTIIMFHPEATPASMRQDLAFVRQHAGHPLSFCRAELYAKTPLEQRMIESSRAKGDYLEREFEYADPATALAFSTAKDVLSSRFFGPDNLMGRVIQLDHLTAVYRHFYEGPEVAQLAGDYLAFELEVNLDTIDLLEEVIAACEGRARGALSDFDGVMASLARRERARRQGLERRWCEFRERLYDQSSMMVRLARSASQAASPIRRPKLPRHAAAVLLAVGLGCSSSDPAGTEQGTGGQSENESQAGAQNRGGGGQAGASNHAGSAGANHQGGAGSGKSGGSGWTNTGGVIEAAPPPGRGGGYLGGGGNGGLHDAGNDGSKDAAPDAKADAAGRGGWVNTGGVIEAAPPPGRGGFFGSGGKADAAAADATVPTDASHKD